MTILSRLRVLLTAETDDYKKGLGDATKATQEFNEGAKSTAAGADTMASAFGKIAESALLVKASAAAISFVKDSIVEAENAAKVQAQVSEVIQSTGAVAGISAQDVDNLSQQFSKLTGAEDDLIARGEAVLLTFTGIHSDVFPRATAAALDMTSALNGGEITAQGLQTQIISVGKALNDFSGYTALKRQGVSFVAEQEDMIKKFKETNDLAGYQNLILTELEREFKGQAEAMHEAGAKSDDLTNSTGNLKEAFGAGLLPVLRPINEGLSNIVDTLTASIVAENDLKAAADQGIITKKEATEQINKMTWTSYTSADAQAWLTQKTGEYTEQLKGAGNHLALTAKYQAELKAATDESSSAMESGAQKMGQYSQVASEGAPRVWAMATATEGLAKMAYDAAKGQKSWLDAVNQDIGSQISDQLDKLSFAAAGGDKIQAAYQQVHDLLGANLITPEDAKRYYSALYVESQNLQTDLGQINASQAAQNISDQLKIPLSESKDMLDQLKSDAQFSITSEINVRVNWLTGGWKGGAPLEDVAKPKGHGIQQAAGGEFRPFEPLWIGEHGPEPVFPAVAGRTLSVEQAQAAMSKQTVIQLGGIHISGVGDASAAYNAGRAAGRGVLDEMRARGIK